MNESAVGATVRVRVSKTDVPRPVRDSVIAEEPLEIRLQRGASVSAEVLAVTMRTPGNDLELAAGFLWSEGVIQRPEQLIAIKPCSDRQLTARQRANTVTCVVDVPQPSIIPMQAGMDQHGRMQRRFIVNSACGVCGTNQIDDLRLRCVEQIQPTQLSLQQLIELPSQLRDHQPLFDRTGGVHAAAIFDPRGDLHAIREDVGRHNAVDKVVGHALMQGLLPLHGWALAVSGRCGFEIVAKALTAGIGAVVSISAPTSLAVETAQEFGIQLIGFARAGQATIYT